MKRTDYRVGKGLTNLYDRRKERQRVNQRATNTLRTILNNRAIPRQLPVLGRLRRTGNFGRFGQGGEQKFIDILQGAFVPAATGTIFPTAIATFTPAVAAVAAGTFCQIVQGDQEYQRIGKEVIINKVMVRGYFLAPEGATSFSGIVRFIILQDTQCNGAAPTPNNILNFTGQPVSVNSFNNIENSRRFITICDETTEVTPYTSNAALANNPRYVPFEIFKKVNIPIVYDSSATTGALATIRSNNILGVAVSPDAETQVVFNCRLRYSDK